VVCGAPLAARTSDIAAALLEDERTVSVVATPPAMAWIDVETVSAVVGQPPAVDYRSPVEAKRGPEADAVVICPISFNSLNKVVAGIADTYALGVMCEAIGQGLPVIAVPMVNDRLWSHPTWSANLDAINRWGVRLLDIHTGEPGARLVPSGAGAEVVARFEPEWIRAALDDVLSQR
jgi:phosphopantothenoylcysteine synthetase/decarboxylase